METTADDGLRLDPITDLLLREATDLTSPVAVLDDLDGALTTALLDGGHRPRVWCDDLRDEESALLASVDRRDGAEIARTPEEAVTGARLVLWRLPKAVGAVEEYAGLIARHSAPAVRVVAAGRDKHLSRGMNEALARHFTDVRASLGHRKARALLAEGPNPGPIAWPRTGHLAPFDLDLAAHGATFSTFRLDHGTALLASVFEQWPDAEHAIDLGCGSGVLAALLARTGRRVTAIDVTWSGCDATRLTAEANGLQIEVLRRDGLAGWSDPVGLIVMNPPFHVGSAKDTEPTRALIDQAAAALTEDGELWCVYNSHLPYLHWLNRAVGPTRIVTRDRGYLVTRSVRRPNAPDDRR